MEVKVFISACLDMNHEAIPIAFHPFLLTCIQKSIQSMCLSTAPLKMFILHCMPTDKWFSVQQRERE